MKILFIFTGGTIGSTRTDDTISTDRSKSYKIIMAYKERYGIDFEYDTAIPYTELSENNTGKHIRLLCECVKENISAGYDGIIVTHGTDTLQYSAAALGYSIGLDSVPVCLVSANYPIEDERSNALYNLHGALKLIKDGLLRGAFVVYQNEGDEQTRVHRATRLIASKAYSDEVSSIFGSVVGHFTKDFVFIKNRKFKESPDALEPLDACNMNEEARGIMLLPSYPGMSYPSLDGDVKYVILGSYHSGTVNTSSETARIFFEAARRAGVEVFVTGVSDGAQYESAVLFDSLGITPLKNISPIASYVKLWMLSSSKKSPGKYMDLSLSGDIRQ